MLKTSRTSLLRLIKSNPCCYFLKYLFQRLAEIALTSACGYEDLSDFQVLLPCLASQKPFRRFIKELTDLSLDATKNPAKIEPLIVSLNFI